MELLGSMSFLSLKSTKWYNNISSSIAQECSTWSKFHSMTLHPSHSYWQSGAVRLSNRQTLASKLRNSLHTTQKSRYLSHAIK